MRVKTDLLDRALDRVQQEVAPRLPVRDLLALREQHGGLSGDELAEAVISRAARTTAALGAAAGALTTVETAAPPALLASPLQVVAETVAVVAVELRLTAELHVVYGRAVTGTPAEVATAYLASWAGRRVAAGEHRRPSVGAVLGSAVRQQLRSRLVRRFGRNLSTLVPFFAGAVAGAELNRRETRALGAALLRDLSPQSLRRTTVGT